MQRSVTLGIVTPYHYAFEEHEYRLPWQLISRPPDAFHGDDGFPGVALTLNPRLRALGLRPRHSTFQVGYHRRRGNRRPVSADNRQLTAIDDRSTT